MLIKMNFNEKVWKKIKLIPKGKISTYKEIAKAIGNKNSARAIGNACNKNPFAPKVPCHRVIKSNGSLGGFAFGTKQKISLLKNEGIEIKKEKIIDFKEKLFKF